MKYFNEMMKIIICNTYDSGIFFFGNFVAVTKSKKFRHSEK